MRLWRVCVKSMEKQLDNLAVLTEYQNRQVILNYYCDEDYLYDRYGFNFKTIEVTLDALSFIKEDGSEQHEILLKEYPETYINSDFQHYYTLRNGENRIDIYFPH